MIEFCDSIENLKESDTIRDIQEDLIKKSNINKKQKEKEEAREKNLEDFIKYNIITYSQDINTNCLKTYFEDEELENKYSKHHSGTPKKTVVLLSLVILIFYISHITFSVSNYFSLIYTVSLIIVISIHVVLAIAINLSNNTKVNSVFFYL